MRNFGMGVAMVAVHLVSPASANEWIYNDHGGTVGVGGAHIAMVALQDSAVGVQCDEVELSFFYITPAMGATATTLEELNELLPRLVLEIDDREEFAIFGQGTLASTGQAMIVAPISGFQLEPLAVGAESITAAVLVEGHFYHRTEFAGAGAVAAIDQLISECDNPALEF